MKTLTIVGARPQFVKAAALSREISERGNITDIIVHTGQHFDTNMSEVFFEEMEIPKPKHNLAINSLGHGAMTGRMLEEIEIIILEEKPDFVIVYGDTNSTLAGALAAKKLHIKVVHIESGLRSFNNKMPEEINRILTDRISDYLFCPTQTAVNNLDKEGFNNYDCKVFNSGDIMLDTALFYSQKSVEKGKFDLKTLPQKYILNTLHRAENTDDKNILSNIVNALNYVHENICPIVLALHPRTKAKLEEFKLNLDVIKIKPVGYFDMINLIKNSELVMTDSGGLQKEAYFFEKPCLTLREQTEWIELTENKVNTLVGSDEEKIISETKKMLNSSIEFSKKLYGNGSAAKKIVDFLIKNSND